MSEGDYYNDRGRCEDSKREHYNSRESYGDRDRSVPAEHRSGNGTASNQTQQIAGMPLNGPGISYWRQMYPDTEGEKFVNTNEFLETCPWLVQ